LVVTSSEMDFGFVKEISKFGGASLKKCFQCGSCTAICPIASESSTFPRRLIRDVQLGLKDRVRGSLDPWLCFYCGECSESCPRGADPGEVMMAVRRYQIAKNSWFKPTYRLSVSTRWELFGMGIFAAVAALLIFLLHGPVVTNGVQLTTFAPPHVVELVDYIFAAVIGAGMLANIAIMYRSTKGDGPAGSRRSLLRTITNLPRSIKNFISTVPKELFVQASYYKCARRTRWFSHLVLVLGYMTMFSLTVILLPYYLMDGMLPPLQRTAAYFGAGALIFGVVYSIWGRIRKDDPQKKTSHYTDWSFLILLLLVASTGVAVHVLKYASMAISTYWVFSIHLVFAMTLLGIAPYMKWSHAFYRPFAAYFKRNRSEA
jgi:quinone-modifying oxidoreductase, subunit QmoC